MNRVLSFLFLLISPLIIHDSLGSTTQRKITTNATIFKNVVNLFFLQKKLKNLIERYIIKNRALIIAKKKAQTRIAGHNPFCAFHLGMVSIPRSVRFYYDTIRGILQWQNFIMEVSVFMSERNIIDDGFNAELVETAFFDGVLEMPRIERPKQIIIPPAVIPFSKRNRSKNYSECLVFYEHDKHFADVLKRPDTYLDDIMRFPFMATLDCSVYRDMPLLAQMANVYRSRAIGHYYQTKGVYVIPNVRWGDERSYTAEVLPEKFAFLGLPKNSIVSVGTYGCVHTREDKLFFRHGLEAMLEELVPEVVMVYGSMPDSVFAGLYGKTRFIHYADWISQKRRRAA